MAAQFPSICYIKGVYAAQSNLRINRRRLPWSSQDGWSTTNWPVSMFLFLFPTSVYAALSKSVKSFPRSSLEAVKAAHDTPSEFGRPSVRTSLLSPCSPRPFFHAHTHPDALNDAASIRICLQLYVSQHGDVSLFTFLVKLLVVEKFWFSICLWPTFFFFFVCHGNLSSDNVFLSQLTGTKSVFMCCVVITCGFWGFTLLAFYFTIQALHCLLPLSFSVPP